MIPVSICLTTYNRASVLPATLDSILNQNFPDFELIINDDCSTDKTEEVCREYLAKDTRIKYFRNSENLKMPGNLNSAIQHASGFYIANLHDGDFYRKDLISKWKAALDSDPDTPFVFNAYDVLLPDGSHKLYSEPFNSRVPGSYIGSIYFESLGSCVWGTVMARASAYAEHGVFDPAFGFISDVDMWLRLAKGRNVAYVPEPLITVTSREPDHPFAHYSWQHLFWQFGIYNRHIKEYMLTYPHPVLRSPTKYSLMVRRMLLQAMVTLIRHRKWRRVMEGLAIWNDSSDPVLRTLGVLGRAKWQPEWYEAHWWRMVGEFNGATATKNVQP